MSVNKYNSTTGNLERLDGYTVDSTPTQNSGNPVSSGGVYTAVDGCVHKTGNETIGGNKTFSGDVAIGGDLTFTTGGGRKWSVFKTGTTHSYDGISISDLKNKYAEILVIPCTSTGTEYSLPFVIPVNEISWNDEYIFYGTRNPDIGIRISGSAATHPNTFYVFVDDLSGNPVNTSYTVYAR